MCSSVCKTISTQSQSWFRLNGSYGQKPEERGVFLAHVAWILGPHRLGHLSSVPLPCINEDFG